MFYRTLGVCALSALVVTAASASPIYWTDWATGDLDPSRGFEAQGTITTPSTSVAVTYRNPRGVAFLQSGTGTDYFQVNGVRDPSTSPYTSAAVDNIPTPAEMIGLRYATSQELLFSEAVVNPVFSFVSMEGYGFAFSQDFEVLSVSDPSDGNSCGFWGCGSVRKEIVDLGDGTLQYRLVANGDSVPNVPHGSIRLLGEVSSVSWLSLSNDNWHGFTVGIPGTSAELLEPVDDFDGVFTPASVPEPATLALVALGCLGLRRVRRREYV